jgi:hypothetical protein
MQLIRDRLEAVAAQPDNQGAREPARAQDHVARGRDAPSQTRD